MKKRIVGGGLALVLGVFTLNGERVSAEELTVANFVPPQHHINRNLFGWFGKEIAKRSGGSLTMKLFPSGQLGAGPVQQYKRVVEGVADITFGVSAYTAAIFPKTMLIIPPGKSTTAKESTNRLWRVFDKYMADEYKNVKALGVFTVAGSLIASTKDISTMQGLKGAKLVPYAAMTTPIIKAMGAVPVQMPVTQMYTGLSTGTIDATYASFNNITPPWNFWDVAKYVVGNAPVQFAATFVAMNKERYDGLSTDHRKIIDDLAGKTMSDQGSATFDGADQRSEGMMKKSPKMKKVKWVQVAPAERAKMDAAVKKGLESIFADYNKRGIKNAREIYNALNQ
jgi:TRAP-type transport system periplasmic protein